MTSHDQISTPDGLSAFAAEWFGVSVPRQFASEMADVASRHKSRWETTAGPYCWVKNRLLESSLMPRVVGCSIYREAVTAVLHVGFVFIEETDEMVSRLKNEQAATGSPSRSAFFREARRASVSPIDGTAARVTGAESR